MSEFLDYLRRRIRHDGPLSVADYMAEVLGNPNYGYYMTRDPFGRAGDFTTAPEVSQMFGELVGLWLADAWVNRGQPETVHLVELGPGRGTLMADILRAAKMAPGFTGAIRVHLVETSPVLRKAQEGTLEGRAVTWHDRLDTVPVDGALFAVANEFFDALPIHQLVRTKDGWRERVVGLGDDGESLTWGLSPMPSAMEPYLTPDVRQNAAGGALAEVCPVGEAIAEALGARIADSDGVGLFVDYGYAKSTCGDTLQALRDHRYTDPLATPGDADLTAHVDFDMLGRAVTAGGARSWPLLGQGAFLERLGIAARAQALKANATPAQATDIDAALARLTAPDRMGDLFKVLAVTATPDRTPAGWPENGLHSS